MKLPLPIRDYFDADKDLDGNPPTAAFAADASVTDEGRTHVGHQAIADWWSAAKRKYRHTAQPLDIREDADIVEVCALVTGLFPGSPATLRFRFGVKGDKIASLTIGA